jgi:signal recognition particle subunit SRP54
VFEKISEKLKDAIKSLRGLNTVSEKNIAGALRDVRDAFLDADVTFDVIRAFLEDVRQKAIGEKVIRAISPGQQLIKIINDAMIDLFGRETKFCEDKPLRVLLLGLNGSGKTTSAIKLAKWLQRKKYTPLLVACDLQRPAAIDQLEQMANAESIKCYVERGARSAISVAKKANKYAD